jgi:hypothetical protein
MNGERMVMVDGVELCVDTFGDGAPPRLAGRLHHRRPARPPAGVAPGSGALDTYTETLRGLLNGL